MDPSWSELPRDIVDSILERLHSVSDYLRFSVVCQSWHSAAKDSKDQRAKMMSGGHHPPMLLIHTNENDTWNLYNFMEDKLLDLQLAGLDNYKWFPGSSKGWLIAMDENLAVTLINPFLRVKGREKENSIIRLPSLTPSFPPSLTPPLRARRRDYWCKNCERFVFKATITADPILNADDCIVVVMYQEFCELAFIRINKDKAWTYIGGDYPLIEEVAYVDGEFYAVNFWSELLRFEITNQFHLDIEKVAHGIPRSEKFFTRIYLVDSTDKEFWLVNRYIYIEDDKRVTKKFRVFAFDFSTFEWREKISLGDVALFLGDSSSVSVSASKFPGCRPSCIYFLHDRDRMIDDGKPRDFGVYNFRNHKLSKHCNKRAKDLMKKTERYPIWIMPTFQL